MDHDPIVDVIPTQVWRLAHDGTLDFVNTRWLEYTGLTTGEARTRGLLHSVHPDDAERFKDALADLNQAGFSRDMEVRLCSHSGDYRWFLVRMTMAGGRCHGTNTDIHELRQARDANERMARSQVEALKFALDSLATEASSDRLAQHIAGTITEQLGAHSSSVWRRNEERGAILFEFAFEGGRFVTKSDALIAGLSLVLPMEESYPWAGPFREGKHCHILDIRTSPRLPLGDRLIAIGVVTVLMVPMLVAGQIEGVFAARFTRQRPMLPEEIGFAQTLANQAVLAMQLTRLSAEARESAVIAERNRLARDIHDTLAQGFTGVIVQLQAAEDARQRGLAAAADEHVRRARDMARESLGEARRSVHALRPQTLEENDLCEALDAMIAKMTAGTVLQSEFSFQGNPRPLPATWEENLLHIGQEALTNVLRHAGAHNFKAQITFERHQARLDFRDDGRGFDVDRHNDGFGLRGMRERVERMGGELVIRSEPGRGAAIHVTVPLKAVE